VNLKKQLRQAIRSRLASFESGPTTSTMTLPDQHRNLNKNLQELIVQLLGEQNTQADVHAGRITTKRRSVWTAFQPMAGEPDIRSAISNLTEIDWAFPRIDGEELAFFLVPSEQALKPSSMGFLEPDPNSGAQGPVANQEIFGLVIPGLAFDEKCNRLGRGRGFYDRTLARIEKENKKTIKIGVAFEPQISAEEIPMESFDHPMDWVVTERRVIRREVQGGGRK
jgi:5-formyltetrahydrofolate cyclo-ligase